MNKNITKMKESIEKMKFLDGVRGFAAILVVTTHAGIPYWNFGVVAVDIFFVLSAFLLTMKAHQIISKLHENKKGVKEYVDFLGQYFI